MPPTKKSKIEHAIDSSGVLEAAKSGTWAKFNKLLTTTANTLDFEDFNELPPGRSYGVVHQIAFHGNLAALTSLLDRHPRVDVKMRTKDGKTLHEVAIEHNCSTAFMEGLNTAIGRQDLQTLVSLARDGAWSQFNTLFASSNISADQLNTVPPGRIWGVLHQIAYNGNQGALDTVIAKHPTLNLELETSESTPQTPLDISQGRGHKGFTDKLRALIDAAPKPASGASEGASSLSSAIPSTYAAMKVPVDAKGKLCNICYCTEDKDGEVGVACDNDHFLCQECFTAYVTSESDTVANPQNIIKNGGQITCVCKIASGCDSHAFANKLIAMVVPDEVYESYLKARDFVVGKDAVAGALAKVKDSGGAMNAVEQEQIRNLYKKANGTYSCYMCKKCKFGPIDHGWCSDLTSHQGEQKSDNSTINNACPKCGWFATQIKQWPHWDGSFIHQNDPSSVPVPSSSSSSSSSNSANLSLFGKTVVFSGTMSVKRSIAKQMAISAGAKVTTAVSGNTDVLVCGFAPGSKEDEADYYGCEVWTDAMFINACNN